MRLKLFLIASCIFFAASLYAQSENSSYLAQAWESLNSGNCAAAKGNYDMYRELSGERNLSLEKAINDCNADTHKKVEKKRERVDLMDNSYCAANKNRYIAWSIAGAGYPWSLASGIEFRGGGIVGIGAYADVGVDFTHVLIEKGSGYWRNDDYATKAFFHYAAGIKFYPYRGLFVDAGYGSIAKPVAGDHKYTKDAVWGSVVQSHGVLFHAGYNLVTDLSDKAGFFLGVSGGASYDVVNKVFAPSVSLKIGVAWGWRK